MLCDLVCVFVCQAEDGIRYLVRSRGLGEVYKRQGNGLDRHRGAAQPRSDRGGQGRSEEARWARRLCLAAAPRSAAAAEAAFLQPGTAQVAAGYAVYGPTTVLVLTVGDGVVVFTLDREQGQFVLTQENVQIPADTQEFAINMANQRFWEAPVQRYVHEMQQGKTGPLGKDYNMRWVGSMVADVHRIMTRGGIFMYPIDSKLSAQGGKLRLMYEANPMAMLVEQAHGAAIDCRELCEPFQGGRLFFRAPRGNDGEGLAREAPVGQAQERVERELVGPLQVVEHERDDHNLCLLYTSPSPRDRTRSRMPSSA